MEGCAESKLFKLQEPLVVWRIEYSDPTRSFLQRLARLGTEK
jgi:hypothetical protein